MISEHTGLMDAMMPALRRMLRANEAPQRLATADELALRHLQSVSPAGFDRAYALQQVGDHLATLTAFQTEADNGTDPQLKALARTWLPTIQAHLELPVDLSGHIAGSSPFKSHRTGRRRKAEVIAMFGAVAERAITYTAKMSDLRFLVSAVAFMTVAMGVGRFAYTPLLPVMVAGAGLSVALAGILASANLAGYLLGALLSMTPHVRAQRVRIVRASAIAVALTTALMGVPSTPLWIACRFVTGVASGFVFVLASSIVLDRAAAEGKARWPAIFYCGPAVGIVLSGLLVPPLARAGGWQGAWIGLGAASAVLIAVTMPAFRDGGGAPSRVVRTTAAAPAHRGLFWWLFWAYGGEGFGYVIPATFMVAMVSATAAFAPYAALSWVAVGAVAIPSLFLWTYLGEVMGRGSALALALAVQGVGIAVPVFSNNAFGVAAAAVTLGGFLGITALGSAFGRELYPDRSALAIGRLTAVFGVGQILGPLVATALIARSGRYDAAVLCAAGVLVASALVLGLGLVLSRLAPVRESA